VVFPKSATPERIAENFDIFDFHLTDAEMESIQALDAGERIGPDPDTFVRP
jgi:2,5-diketo-D-gluconate reductase A